MTYFSSFGIDRFEDEGAVSRKGQLGSPEAVRAAAEAIIDQSTEKLILWYLDENLRPLVCELVSLGDMMFGSIEAKDIFKIALLLNTPNLLLVHTHATGSNYPTVADLGFIRKIQEQADVMRLRLVDFVVVGPEECWSALEEKVLEPIKNLGSHSKSEI
jgi:DNA repair protein RadC